MTDPSLESFMEELDLVVARHNDVGTDHGFEVLCAIIAQKADHLAQKTGVDIDVDELDADGQELGAIKFSGDRTSLSIQGDIDAVDVSKIEEQLDDDVAIGSAEMLADADAKQRGEST